MDDLPRPLTLSTSRNSPSPPVGGDVDPIPAGVDDSSFIINFRDERRMATSMPTFDRQISLDSGIAVLGTVRESANNQSLEEPQRLAPDETSPVGSGAFRGGDAGQKKRHFNIFRTKSALVSRQNSSLPVRGDNDSYPNSPVGAPASTSTSTCDEPDEALNMSVPAGRYFAALQGPELDQVKDYEDILLPKDELWPFLLRFPVGCFGICLGLGSVAVLWGALATSPATAFLKISPNVNVALWFIALGALVSISVTYTLKCVFYFEAVRREYFHPVRVNFFFSPWIGCMFLAIGAPPRLLPKIHPIVWCICITPLIILELKIYGQWLSGGKRRLSKVANPTSHLSVVGNFIGAILAAKVGWLEPAKFLWAVGLAHYLCVFVTLYQRLPTSEALPKELHPVYTMFIATPMAACVAWKATNGHFDNVARLFFFIAIFLYCSLIVRINFFRGFKFSLAWWAYTFPLTTMAVATIRYAEEVPCVFTKGLAAVVSFMSSTVVLVIVVSTLLHAFVWRSLFPNDLAIAITKTKGNHGSRQRSQNRKESAAGGNDFTEPSSSALVSLFGS